MDNMGIYTKARQVPQDAQKEIKGGRLSGYTDINPMWRIKLLTELFGACGIGWKYTIDSQWLEQGANNEIAAFVNISLFIKCDDQWSDAIPGTGGSTFVAKEKSGLYTSDECYKMALTDAISVACKALGFGADIYWAADRTKYNQGQPDYLPPSQPEVVSTATPKQITYLLSKYSEEALQKMLSKHGVPSIEDLPRATASDLISRIKEKEAENKGQG